MDLYIGDDGVVRMKEEPKLVLSTSDYNEFELEGVDSENIDETITFLNNVVKMLNRKRDEI